MGIQLQTGQKIDGIPALEIRDLLRGVADSAFAKEWLHEKGFCEAAADYLLQVLLQNGYIELDLSLRPASDPRIFYRLTEQGSSMMRATGSKRVRRKTAQQVLKDFMNRVQIVNESPRFLVGVLEVILFGSYLSDMETLGDLDIACSYKNKIAHLDREAFVQKTREHFEASGRHHKGFMSELFWPWEEVQLFLKSKKRTISLHRIDEVEQMIQKSDDFRFEVLLGDRETITSRSKQREDGPPQK